MIRLSRRAFLGGAGALVALPFLESLPGLGMRRAWAADSGEIPSRLITYFVPNGIRMDQFLPAKTGADWEITPTLQPLSAFQDEILILSGLGNAPGMPEDGAGDHAAGTGSFITGRHVKRTEGADIENGISLDQAVAAQIGQTTRFASLQLGLEGGSNVGGCDFGYSCAYLRNISWQDEHTPLPKMINPQLVFDRLFAGADATASEAEIAMRRKHRKSVLDYVTGEAKTLQKTVSGADHQKLEAYLDGVRELEKRIESLVNAPTCEPPGYPPPTLEIEAHAKLMADLMTLALQCDLTRVVSFMFANGFSTRHYAHLGVAEGHHELSHHQESPEKIAQLLLIDRWEVSMLAYLLERLKAVPQGDGSLLDHTLVLWASPMSDGNTHNHFQLPIVLAGRAGGALSPGRHLSFPDDMPVTNLWLAIAQSFGLQLDSFGDDSVAPLAGLSG